MSGSDNVNTVNVPIVHVNPGAVHFVTGVCGGLTPQGLIRMHPFLDVGPRPVAVDLMLQDGLAIGEKYAVAPAERIIPCSLIMTAESAEIVGRWLLQNAEAARQALQISPGWNK